MTGYPRSQSSGAVSASNVSVISVFKTKEAEFSNFNTFIIGSFHDQGIDAFFPVHESILAYFTDDLVERSSLFSIAVL